MKIAIVNGIYFPEPGGAQTQSHNITNKLHELEIKLIAIYLIKQI